MTTTKKQLGIWMDHASAHVMEYTTASQVTKTIESQFAAGEQKELSGKSELVMHNKEQEDMSAYYSDLGKIIVQYDEVILFGPTDAKTELLNILKEDRHFEEINITVKQTDKLTENQQHAFVKEHFSTHQS